MKKERESILRSGILGDIRRLEDGQRRLGFAQPELDRIFKRQCALADLIPKHALAFDWSRAATIAGFSTEFLRATRDIGMIEENAALRAIRDEAERASRLTSSLAIEIAGAVAPLRQTMADMHAQFFKDMESQRRLMETVKPTFAQEWQHYFDTVSEHLARAARVNFALPEIALLHWPERVLTRRSLIIEDCVRNVLATESLHAAVIAREGATIPDGLDISTRFVVGHADVVRRLPPQLPEYEEREPQPETAHRDEEIGVKLETALGGLDERLIDLRQRAWRNLADRNVAGARLAMAGIREVFDEVMRILAPDGEVKLTSTWLNRTDRALLKPTRRMRLDFVLGAKRAEEADALFQFSACVNRTQQFVHTFAEDIELVRVQMSQMETWIYLLVVSSKTRSEQ